MDLALKSALSQGFLGSESACGPRPGLRQALGSSEDSWLGTDQVLAKPGSADHAGITARCRLCREFQRHGPRSRWERCLFVAKRGSEWQAEAALGDVFLRAGLHEAVASSRLKGPCCLRGSSEALGHGLLHEATKP